MQFAWAVVWLALVVARSLVVAVEYPQSPYSEPPFGNLDGTDEDGVENGEEGGAVPEVQRAAPQVEMATQEVEFPGPVGGGDVPALVVMFQPKVVAMALCSVW